MERFHLNACGQNITLNIDSRLYDPANRNVLGPYDYFEKGDPADISLTLAYGKRKRAFVHDDCTEIVHYRSKAGSHIIRQLICFQISYVRRAFELIHGTGILVDAKKNKAILLIGKSNSGKSTLSRSLGEVIMDDDIMLATRDRLLVAGKMGFVTYRHPVHGRKLLTPLPDGAKEAELALVILLEKGQRGGVFWDVDNRIPRKYAVPNDLPPLIKEYYFRLPPIRVDAPIIRIGTRGKLSQTLDTLHQLLDQNI